MEIFWAHLYLTLSNKFIKDGLLSKRFFVIWHTN